MKTEEQLQTELIKNSKYDSDWIAEASKILSFTEDVTEEMITDLNAVQLRVINEVISDSEVSIDINILLDKNLNATQMKLYYIGIKKGLTSKIMEQFLNPDIPYAKTNYMVQALLDGFTGITEYLDFSPDQIAEIYAGMKEGVNYKIYADSDLPAEYMNFIRHALSLEMAFSIKTKYGTIEYNNKK